MARVEENRNTLSNIAVVANSTKEELTISQYSEVMILADISKSLAVIADALGKEQADEH